MGEIKKITCHKCKKSWKCQTGCGMLHGRIEYAGAAFSEEVRQEIKKVTGNNPLVLYDFAFEPVVCSGCKKIVAVPVLSIPSLGKNYIGNCPECDGKVETGKELSCPDCRNPKLDIEQTGLWD